MLSRFENKENENFDIAAAYLLATRDFDHSSSSFGQNHQSRWVQVIIKTMANSLNVTVYNAALKASIENGKHVIQFGNSVEQTNITDKLSESGNTRTARLFPCPTVRRLNLF